MNAATLDLFTLDEQEQIDEQPAAVTTRGKRSTSTPTAPTAPLMAPVWSLQLVCERSVPYGDDHANAFSDQHKAAAFVRALIGRPAEERFVAVFLDTKRRPIGAQIVAVGTLDQALVHPREAFKGALLANAHSVLFAHNHPSGDPTPSQADIKLTRKLANVGSLVSIQVLDHIIIGDGREYSFACEAPDTLSPTIDWGAKQW